MTLLTQELIEQLDEAIENVKELKAERDQLRADKAELVEALERLVWNCTPHVQQHQLDALNLVDRHKEG